MKSEPLYRVIYKDFKSQIEGGKLKPRDKLPTENDISNTYNVSRITAIRALKELELKGLINRVKGSGSYVNENGTSIQSGVPIVSLVIPFGGDFSMQYLQGVEEVVREHGYFVTYHNSLRDVEMERKIIEDLIERGSSGIIVYPTSTSQNLDLYTGLVIDKYPFIMIDHRIPGVDLPLVWTNNDAAFYDITTHLLDLNHKRVIFAAFDMYGVSSEFERYKGYCKAHLDKGVTLMNNHIFSVKDYENLRGNYSTEEDFGEGIANMLFDKLEGLDEEVRPTAIAAVNDEVAAILIDVALKRGIKIPEQYSITGFDNSTVTKHLPVKLTTVDQPSLEIGRSAAKELIETINDSSRKPQVITVDAKVIIKSSTKEYK